MIEATEVFSMGCSIMDMVAIASRRLRGNTASRRYSNEQKQTQSRRFPKIIHFRRVRVRHPPAPQLDQKWYANPIGMLSAGFDSWAIPMVRGET